MAYSQDLRERVIAALESGAYTQPDVAAMFQVNLSTMEKWRHRQRTTGTCEAYPAGRGEQRVLRVVDDWIRVAVAEQPDITLDELCEQLAKEKGIRASASMMCRELKLLALPRKKSRSTTANGRLSG
jgi:transposase